MADYRIIVRTGSSEEALYPLTGVNKGVRYTRGAADVFETYPFDFTELFEAARVASARTHEGGYNVSNLFVVPDQVQQLATIENGVEDEFGVNATNDWRAWLGNLVAGGDARGFEMYLDPRSFEDYSASVLQVVFPGSYLYWYPSLLTDPTNWWSDACRDFDDSGVGEAYEALTAVEGTEVYLRLGEGNFGPTYVGHPDGDDEQDPITGRQGYALVAAEIVADLADLGTTPTIPAFVEFWNETFTGPDMEDEAATATDFVELYVAARQAVHDRLGVNVPFGGFRFSSSKCRDYASEELGNMNSFVFNTLLRAAETGADLDFFSYHWYGTEPELAAGSVITSEQFTKSAFQFFTDLWRMDELLDFMFDTLGGLYGMPTPGNGVHLTEWALRLPQHVGEFQGPDPRYNHALGFRGAAFLSAALTWMQDPDLSLRVERAHYWIGRGRSTGLFHADRVASVPNPAESDKVDVFFVRRPAAAMFLHAGMETLSWDDVEFVDPIPPSPAPPGWTGSLTDPREAAQYRLPVTALAGSDIDGAGESDHTAVVTNLGNEPADVVVRFTGLPVGQTYHVLERQIVQDNPADDYRSEFEVFEYIETRANDPNSVVSGAIQGVLVPAARDLAPDGSVNRAYVDEAVAADLFESELLASGSSYLSARYDRFADEVVLDAPVVLPPFGVARLDLNAFMGPHIQELPGGTVWAAAPEVEETPFDTGGVADDEASGATAGADDLSRWGTHGPLDDSDE